MFKDVQRSVTRTIKNNFMDSSLQEAIDTLLGYTYSSGPRKEFVAADPTIQKRFDQMMQERKADFSQAREVRVCIGTWNVNGGRLYRMKDSSVSDWLVEPVADRAIDIYAVGFQEIVDLTAQNMVVNEQAANHRRHWERELTKILRETGESYSLLEVEQLVGVCLYIFVRADHYGAVTELAKHRCKTGAGGKVGNKGGVGIRFCLYGNSFAFVCAHLAAGQSHVADRNQDYQDITRRLNFRKYGRLEDNDNVFWLV